MVACSCVLVPSIQKGLKGLQSCVFGFRFLQFSCPSLTAPLCSQTLGESLTQAALSCCEPAVWLQKHKGSEENPQHGIFFLPVNKITSTFSSHVDMLQYPFQMCSGVITPCCTSSDTQNILKGLDGTGGWVAEGVWMARSLGGPKCLDGPFL